MTTSEKISSLAEKIDSRKQDRAKAEVAHDAAVESRDKALTRLKDDFKVSSVEEGRKLSTKIQKKIAVLIQEAEEMLSDKDS